MSEWTPLATDFFTDPKVRAVGRDASLLFLAGLCHCQHHVTGGFVADDVLPVLAVSAWVRPSCSTALVTGGLWVRVNGGHRVVAWEDWNRPAEEVEARKEANRRRQAKWRERNVTSPSASRNALLTQPPSQTPIENYSEDGTTQSDPQVAVDNIRSIREAMPR